jgi:intracellular sulfur oxidation DsrE/DsrF family protein
MKRGVVFLMCNNALRLTSQALAKARGEAAEAVYEDLKASRLPGTVLVPAMVVAINRAEEAGFSYVRV